MQNSTDPPAIYWTRPVTCICLCSTYIYNSLGPLATESPCIMILCHGIKRPEREADHSLRLLSRLRTSGAIPPLPHKPSWCAQIEMYLCPPYLVL